MNKVWTEHYRPETLEDFIFSDEATEKLLKIFVREKEIPNLLISGIQGTGKTTIARILIKELGISKRDVKRINASSDNSIANVRESIEPFCKTLGFGDLKIVLLEEADGLSHASQKALRSIIEDNVENVRFIMTCNYPEKIIPALHSRFQSISISTLDKDKVIERVVNILENEDVVVEDVDLVLKHINTYYPDMRKIINSLEQSSKTGTLTDIMSMSVGESDIEEWKNCWETSPKKQALIKIAQNMELNDVDSVYRTMYDNVENIKEDLRNNAYVCIAEHLYKSSFVSDQEINLVACIIEIFEE